MNISRCEIEKYLLEVKNAIQGNRYRIERNSHRQDNINLFLDYVIDETKAKPEILEYLDGKRTNRQEEGTADEKK